MNSETTLELATGEELGTYDSEADVALCLAFAKLSRDEVAWQRLAEVRCAIACWGMDAPRALETP